MEKEENNGTLVPVKTCYILCRDVPVDVKDKLVKIRRKRKWTSWKDMILDVVKEWGDYEDEE